MAREERGFRVEAVKVVLMVRDMDRAVRFYSDAFGFQIDQGSPGWSELTRGGFVLGLHSGGGDAPVDTGLSIQVSDLRKGCEFVESMGGTVVTPPEARPGEPIELAEVRDPEGNRVTITEWIG